MLLCTQVVAFTKPSNTMLETGENLEAEQHVERVGNRDIKLKY